jgi:hypothetical protein
MPLCPQITITPVTVTTSGMTTTSVIAANAPVTTEQATELQTEINSIEAAVNGKNHIYRQTTAPDGSVFALVEGDVWFDTDDGNKQYYWTGSAWVSVQDTGIAAAEAAAAAATTAAEEAETAATAAQTTANGKNKIVRSTADASGTTGYAAGDLWWKMASTSAASNVLDQWTFDGTQWNKNALTNAVIATLDAAKITTGFLAADRIEAASIVGAKIAGNTIEAVNIKALTITAAEIAAETITAAKIATATITADQIAGATITAAEIAAETITALEIEAGSITVDRLTAGTLTAFTLQTSSGNRRVTVSAATNSISFREANTIVGFIGPTSKTGIVMHYGTSFNAAATSFPQAYVTSDNALIAYSSTTYVETSATGVVMSGDVYTLSAFYNQDASTSANAANTRMDTNGRTRRSTASSARFKEDIVNLSSVANLNPAGLLDLPIRAFKFKSDYLDATDNRSGILVPGLIAEEVAEHYPIAADRGEDGLVENWNERFVIPGMLALIQDLNTRIKTLEAGTQ